VFLSY